MDQAPGTRTTDRRSLPVRAAVTAAVLAVLTAAALAFAAPGARPTSVAGQAEPTSTPIQLIRLTPAAGPATDPTATATAEPTSGAVVVIIDEDDADPTAAAEETISLEFEADDWTGAYYQGNGAWYGRAWTAVYGAQSEYPAATLTFELQDAPDQDLVFVVSGLDDELAGKNPIALEVNGERVYQGDSPFESWNGDTTDQARGARWTTVAVTLPAELFVEGENTITFRNLSPSAAFGQPPYNLLSTASLEPDEDEDEDEEENDGTLPLEDDDQNDDADDEDEED